MKTVREGSVVTLPRPDGKTVDVFTDIGWGTHAVFEVVEGRIAKMVKGKALKSEDFKTFKSRL